MKNSNMSPLGFTLIELLVVVLIIGILAAVAVPQYQRAVDKSRYAAMMPIVRAIKSAQEAYYMEHGFYTSALADLDLEPPANCTINGTTATCDKFSISLNSDAYVVGLLLQSPKNAFVIYNDRLNSSLAGLSFCYAYKENGERARKLCLAVGGVQYSSTINGSCSRDCTTYQLP